MTRLEDVQICIPTYARKDKFFTLKLLSDNGFALEKVHVFFHTKEEAEEYDGHLFSDGR